MSPRIAQPRSSLTQAKSVLRASGFSAALALLATIVGVFEVPAAEPAPSKFSKKAEPFDVLYLSDVRPVVLRLQITSNGVPLQEAWNHFADLFFAKLDSDKNGTIDEKELTRLPSMLTLLTGQTNQTGQFGRRVAEPSLPTAMNRAEFGEYLKKHDLGPLRLPPIVNIQRGMRNRIQRMGTPTPEEINKAILEMLDTNKDGKISVEEFTAGIETLSKLDADENELITTEEVIRRPQSPYYIQINDGNEQPSPGVEFLALSQKGTDANLARQILIRYGPKPPNNNPNQGRPGMRYAQPGQQAEPTVRRLSKKELKLSDATFAELDQDGNDELDAEELARFGQSARPDIEIALRLGKLANGVKAAEIIHGGESPLKVSSNSEGSEVAIDIPNLRLDFVPPSIKSGAYKSTLSSYYLNRFHDLDGDANGYLDKNEANNDLLFQNLFSFFDKDGDGKIFEKEVTAALDELEEIALAASNGIVTVDLNEASRGLFGLIDTDGDGKLSLTELRAMPKLVERFGSKKDGTLALTDLPRRFEASLVPGLNLGRAFNNNNQYVDYGYVMPRQRPQVGPMWFQKMDRNRDGYVSRREFLGTDEEFRKLDLNGDGLISVEEAEAAEKAGTGGK